MFVSHIVYQLLFVLIGLFSYHGLVNTTDTFQYLLMEKIEITRAIYQNPLKRIQTVKLSNRQLNRLHVCLHPRKSEYSLRCRVDYSKNCFLSVLQSSTNLCTANTIKHVLRFPQKSTNALAKPLHRQNNTDSLCGRCVNLFFPWGNNLILRNINLSFKFDILLSIPINLHRVGLLTCHWPFHVWWFVLLFVYKRAVLRVKFSCR